MPYPMLTPQQIEAYTQQHGPVSPTPEPPAELTPEQQWPRPLKPQDTFLPIANIFRIMKEYLPPNSKCAKESKECMQECASEFLSFITSEAHDRCIADGRKIIVAGDILVSLAALGFDNYVPLLENYYDNLTQVRTKQSEESLANEANK